MGAIVLEELLPPAIFGEQMIDVRMSEQSQCSVERLDGGEPLGGIFELLRSTRIGRSQWRQSSRTNRTLDGRAQARQAPPRGVEYEKAAPSIFSRDQFTVRIEEHAPPTFDRALWIERDEFDPGCSSKWYEGALLRGLLGIAQDQDVDRC